jgi:hypothetical protein
MTGTEKQIKWAEDIKDATMADFDAIIASAHRAEAARSARGKSAQIITDAVAMVERFLPALLAIDDAKWWIDHRDYDPAAMLGFAAHSDEVIAATRRADNRRYY